MPDQHHSPSPWNTASFLLLLALITLCIGWEALYTPLGTPRQNGGYTGGAASVMVLKAFPLLFFLRPFLKAQRRAHQAMTLLVWLYFTEGCVRGYGDQGMSQVLAWGEIALSLALFAVCVLCVRTRPDAPRSDCDSANPKSPPEAQYETFMRHVYERGIAKSDRTATGTRSVFGYQMRFDLAKGFPLVTTKKVHVKSIIHELLWFLRGDSNARWLQERGVTIWNEWANPTTGELGPIYGVQWRSWPAPDGQHIDQIKAAIQTLQSDPHSRRILVSAWNVADLPQMALQPCHVLFQFYVAPAQEGQARGKLSCQLYQRSADVFLGVPFNIASYALLTHMVAQQCDLNVGEFIWTGGDCHIYDNHRAQVKEQLTRTPFAYPQLHIRRKPASIFDYAYEDFELLDYECHPAIKAPVAI